MTVDWYVFLPPFTSLTLLTLIFQFSAELPVLFMQVKKGFGWKWYIILRVFAYILITRSAASTASICILTVVRIRRPITKTPTRPHPNFSLEYNFPILCLLCFKRTSSFIIGSYHNLQWLWIHLWHLDSLKIHLHSKLNPVSRKGKNPLLQLLLVFIQKVSKRVLDANANVWDDDACCVTNWSVQARLTIHSPSASTDSFVMK